MTRISIRSLCALALGLSISAAANAAADFYLKLDGVDGEVKAAEHEGSLAVASWSFGATQQGSMASSGKGVGRVAAPAAEPAPGSSGTLTVTKQYDKASPKLAMRCANGQHIAHAELKRCESGACRTYALKDVVISSITLSSDGRGSATESLSLNYAKIEFASAAPSELRESPSRPSTGSTTVPPRKGAPQ